MQIFAIHQNHVTLMYIYNVIEMANKVIFLFNTIFVDGYCQFLSKMALRVYFMKCGRRYTSFISLFVELICHLYQILYDIMSRLLEEEFADTKGVIRIGKSKDRQHNREPLNRNESGRFGALKSDSTHHFFRNACTKSVSLRFSQFSGC